MSHSSERIVEYTLRKGHCRRVRRVRSGLKSGVDGARCDGARRSAFELSRFGATVNSDHLTRSELTIIYKCRNYPFIGHYNKHNKHRKQ